MTNNVTIIVHAVIVLAGIAAVATLAALHDIDGNAAVALVAALVGVSGGVAASTVATSQSSAAASTASGEQPPGR